ncbi:MAG TPA: globin domain-containing protein [Burkholderiales bacterium]|nr:globin domain-containing protein [Burkholderiales bacterium]
MTPEQAHIVQTTWRAVLPVGDTFAELFYGRLFAVDPELRKLFKDDMVEQGRNLTAMLSVAAANIGRPERISVALRNLGRRHVAYGVKREHFRTVEDALLFALEHALIDVFKPEVKAAWQAAYAFLSSTMLEAFTPTTSPAAAP